MDNNLAYVKPAVIRDKQHYVCSENSLIYISQNLAAKPECPQDIALAPTDLDFLITFRV